MNVLLSCSQSVLPLQDVMMFEQRPYSHLLYRAPFMQPVVAMYGRPVRKNSEDTALPSTSLPGHYELALLPNQCTARSSWRW